MTTPHRPIAVTGSTGAVGALVAESLAEAGLPLRLLVRDPARAPLLPGATAQQASYDDSAAATEALAGVDVLFMVSAAENEQRLAQHRAFIDAAVAAGVQHIVYTSFLGAAPDATFTLARDHFATEQHLRASGLGWTFLRDSFYADIMPFFVGEDGVLRGPAGDGRVSLVARADVAAVAAAILRDSHRHLHAAYDLTGPEALTLTEVAAVLTEALGKPISFHNETVPEAYESRAKWQAPDWQNDAWVSTYTAIAAGEVAAVSDDVERITGARPLTLAEAVAPSA